MGALLAVWSRVVVVGQCASLLLVSGGCGAAVLSAEQN